MSEFRRISDDFYAAPQIGPQDVAVAAAQGITMIVNNRPDGEAADQPPGAQIEAAARAAGIAYRAIPVTAAGFSHPQIAAMREALGDSPGPVLAFCRSGTRSTLLRALAEAASGRDPDQIAEESARGGYDCTPIAAIMDMLAQQGGEGA